MAHLGESHEDVFRVWDVATGKDIRQLQVKDKEPTTVVRSRDGRYLLTSSDRSNVRLWELASGQLVREFPGLQKSSAVTHLAIDADAKQIAIGYRSGGLALWDAALGRQFRNVLVPPGYSDISTLQMQGIGQLRAVYAGKKGFMLSDIADSKPLATMAQPPAWPEGQLFCLPKNDRYLYIGHVGGLIEIWDILLAKVGANRLIDEWRFSVIGLQF